MIQLLLYRGATQSVFTSWLCSKIKWTSSMRSRPIRKIVWLNAKRAKVQRVSVDLLTSAVWRPCHNQLDHPCGNWMLLHLIYINLNLNLNLKYRFLGLLRGTNYVLLYHYSILSQCCNIWFLLLFLLAMIQILEVTTQATDTDSWTGVRAISLVNDLQVQCNVV